MMYLFVTDYDGTLLIDDKSMMRNKQKIDDLHENGVIIVISTGRSFNSIKKQTEKYNLYYDYLHCADGAVIFDKDDNLVNFYEIDHKIIKTFYDFANKLNYEEIQICYPEEYKNIYNPNDKIAGINLVLKGEMMNNDILNEFNSLKNHYPNYNFLYYDHGKYVYLCIKKDMTSKSLGIKFMETTFNIPKENIFVIGDSNNDLEMIKDYNGVCIINDNLDIQKISSKKYHQVYEYINDIEKNISNRK